ncbi:putative bifunctional diguanylate cyclase/phosphodiesterase [Motiliproteus sp.]|uniref:putative bifunctional diguanylate cyclase/phosphodiesterase n=1 Tax=Motiliproteus sp. TaxID=1898955 RepID=UPI003BACF0A4
MQSGTQWQHSIEQIEGFYRHLFKSSFGATLIVELSSLEIVCFTAVATDTLSLTPEQLQPSHKSQYQSLPLFQQLRQRLRLLDDSGELEFDLKVDAKPGQARYLRVYVRRFELAERQLLRVYLRDLNRETPEGARLKELNERLSLATEAAGSGIWDLNLITGQLEWDEQQHRLFGTRADTFTGTYEDWRKTLHPDDLEPASRSLEQAVAGRRPYNAEFRVIWPDGQVRHIEAHGLPQYDEQGNPVRLVGVNWDITPRKRSEQALRQAAALFDSSPEAIIATNTDGVIKMVNRAFTRITGYSSEEAIGQSTRLLKSGRHGKPFYQALWAQLLEQGSWEGELWNRRKNGEVYPEWKHIKAITNEQGETVEYIAIFSDITERKRQEQHIWRQANYDELTGLANRNLLENRVTEALGQDRRDGSMAGLMFVDLDRFKVINDSMGHETGDQLLKQTALRLKDCVDTLGLVARLGSDEFAILLPNTNAEAIRSLGRRIIDDIAQPYTLNKLQLQLGCSIGASTYPQDGDDYSTLLKKADIAMSKAKSEGTNRLQLFTQNMQDALQARVETERLLRRAIEQQQFELYLQPIVEVDKGHVIGAEALLRWQDPERGLISPADFIPVAEECGLIVALGEWVLEQAMQILSDWQARGLTLRLSVNVSSIQFQQPDFVGRLLALMQQYSFERSRLVLEVTETVLIDNLNYIEQRMASLRAEGVRVALDDFGTGYSSLSYLKSLKADYIKIDRSFINECPQNSSDAHLVQAIIRLAAGLEMDVIAEGVEELSQLAFLKGTGCRYYQGYLKSRPVPIAEFEAVMAAEREIGEP